MRKHNAKQPQRKRATGAERTAKAIYHCLKYISEDATKFGMNRTAKVLDHAAYLAVSEAKSVSMRS